MKINYIIQCLTLLTLLPISLSFNKLEKLPIKNRDIIISLQDKNNLKDNNIIKNKFLRDLNYKLNFDYEIKNEFNEIGNIVQLKVNEKYLDIIKKSPYIQNLTLNKSYQQYNYNKTYFDSFNYDNNIIKPDQNYSRKEMNYPNYSSFSDGKNVLIAIIDTGFDLKHEMFSNIYDVNINIDRTKLKFAKNFKKYNNKIPFYYNYGSLNNSIEALKDIDETAHGTHVSGIIGANNSFIGSAKNSSLALMKATTEKGSFTNELILKALEDAMLMEADVINMSLGTFLEDQDNNVLFDNIAKKIYNKGRFINMAAGNDGRGDLFSTPLENLSLNTVEPGSIGGFALSKYTSVVGSSNLDDDILIPSSIKTFSNKIIKVRDQVVSFKLPSTSGPKSTIYDPMLPLHSLINSNNQFEYVFVPNLGKEEDYKSIDVKDKIAIVLRGEITFAEKVKNAKKHGAIAVLVSNNKESNKNVKYFNFENLEQKYLIPTGYIDYNSYVILKSESEYKLTIGKDYISAFSSDGSTAMLNLIPDIVAPGNNVFSGIDDNKYRFYSGTSMAAPNFSGLIACIIGELKNKGLDSLEDRKDILNKVMSNSRLFKQINNAYYSPRKMGAGIPDLKKTLESPLFIKTNNEYNKSKIELKNNNDIKKGIINFDYEIVNYLNQSIKYKQKLVIEAPDIIKADHCDKSLNNGLIQYDKNIVLEEIVNTVELNHTNNKFNVNYEISKSSKEYLSNFPNGTFIEGYLVLECIDNPTYDLNIPFNGFYGDYDNASCVEDFDFEKTNKDILDNSDILNSYVKDSLGLKNADFGSFLRVSNKYYQDLNGFYHNRNTILKESKPVTINKKDNSLVLGTYNESNHVLIQQSINRTIIDNKVTLRKKETNEVCKTWHLENSVSLFNHHSSGKILVKSLAYDRYSGSNIANKAYLFINLFDKKDQPLFEDGKYILEFDYTLPSKKHQVKRYNVIISYYGIANEPTFIDYEFIYSLHLKKDAIRFYFNGDNIASIYENKINIDFYYDKEKKIYFYDKPLDSLKNNNEQFNVKVVNKKGAYLTLLYRYNKNNKIDYIINNQLNKVDKFNYKLEDILIDNNNQKIKANKISFNFFNSSNKVNLYNEKIYNVYIQDLKNYKDNEIELYTYDENNELSKINYTLKDGQLSFVSEQDSFILVKKNKKNNINLLTIYKTIRTLFAIVAISLIGIIMLYKYMLRKQK